MTTRTRFKLRTLILAVASLTIAACQTSAPEPESASTTQTVSVSATATPSVNIPPTESNQQITAEPPAAESIHYGSLWDRIRAGFQLQEHYTQATVAEQIDNYRANQRYFDLVAERARPFLFAIVTEIEERNLPMELALLPMVESTFNPSAHSRENAVGLWQFLRNTGSSLGLQQDWWYDARRDPLASTPAALDYLQAYYTRFDEDWLLALAAYNTGGGNLNRAIRRSASEEVDFWELPLPAETRRHIPRLLALAQIVLAPAQFDIELPDIANADPLAIVDIGSQIDLGRVAELIDLDAGELRALNPGYLQWATHPEEPQEIVIPHGKQALLQEQLANLDQSQFVSWEHYQIRQGDTLGAIARKLNTTVDVLQTVNQIRGSRIIAGRSLLIPRGSGATDLASLPNPPMTQTIRRAIPNNYTIRSGDNLWSIARRFDLRSSEIAAWNGIAVDELLHPGQTLDLSYALQDIASTDESSESTAMSYIVSPGDSPARIAQAFNITLERFLTWNNLSHNSVIYPGQSLYISAPESRLN